ncbi:MAG: MFS transporter [Clostridia bacterium]|nr:MFS transporter [Clostridia bacterium]
MNSSILKRSQRMYVLEAAIEYFISILVSGTYLANLTSAIGLSDGLTGILSSIISLGCVFQLIAIFLRRNRVKRLVIAFSILNQLLFTFLYAVPCIPLAGEVKAVIFTVVIVLAYFIYNVAHPVKINWLMSLVDNEKRGIFTAKKEVVSLISGMIFSFLMGAMIDYYKAEGKLEVAFVLSAVVMIVLTVLHTLTMLFTGEREDISAPRPDHRELLAVLKNKGILKVTLIFAVWNVATYSATPFYGTYQRKELGFSMTFVAVLSVVYAVARSVFSGVLGKYADKRSFAKMVRLCFGVAALAFLVNTFCVPENGKLVFTLYYTLYAISMAGINSALVNLCYDYAPVEKRTSALAITQAISGCAGFFTTLLMSGAVEAIQAKGNRLFGLSLYAQQFTSFFALAVTLIAILLVHILLVRQNKEDL